MANNFNTLITESSKDEWLTPPAIIKALGAFDLDPCSPHPSKRPWTTAKEHYYLPMDGLNMPWHGRVWLNPPYGKETFRWIEKLSEHKDGGIALIFARTETKGFHQHIWKKASCVFFFEGRLSFYHVNGEKGGTANAPSCLVAYTHLDAQIIKTSKLRGKFVNLYEHPF